MNTSLYLLCQILLILLVFGLIGAILWGLNRTLSTLNILPERRKRLLIFIGLGLLFWLSILGVLAKGGYFSQWDKLPPRVIFAAIPPIALTFYLAFFSPFFKKILEVMPLSWLHYVQTFRVIMEVILWLGYVAYFIPLQMTFLWLNQDIIVGLTAPMAAYVFFGKGRFHHFESFIWNIFGIALLLNVVIIGFFSSPSPFRVFMNHPSSGFIGEFPFIWILGFVVPLAIAFHLFALRQLFLPANRQRRRKRLFKLNT